jgi:hypothetical protein
MLKEAFETGAGRNNDAGVNRPVLRNREPSTLGRRISQQRRVGDPVSYSCCMTSSMTTFPPLSTEMTLWMET